MSKFRLFIGNLSPDIKEGELRSKFESLLSSHSEAQVGQVEVRVKNEDNFFGFVNVHVAGGEGKPPPYLLKSIDLMNNTKWKGCLIKVQLAKESFLDKLKREREGGANDEEGQSGKDVEEGEAPSGRGREPFRRDGFQGSNDWRDNRNNRTVFKDNYDFEIVSNNHLDKKREGKNDNSSDEEDEEETSGGIPKFKGMLLSYPNGLPPIPIFPVANNLENQTQLGATVDESAEQEKEGIEVNETMSRLQKIAGYTAAPPRVANQKNKVESDSKNASNHVQKFGFDPFPKPAPVKLPKPAPVRLVIPSPSNPHQPPEMKKSVPQEPPKMGIVLNKRKQQASNILREQSLAKRKDMQSQQSSLIKSSLANSLVSSQPSGDKSSANNKLFAGDEDDDEADTFAVKGQFEGSHGQHLLALKGQWGNDSRFKIDSRFEEDQPEDLNEGDANTAEERNKQLSILNDLLGTQILKDPTAANKKGSTGPKKSVGKDVIIKRYDPDAPEDDSELNKNDDEEDKPVQTASKPKEETSAGTIRSSEPATYKTASNLKALFTSNHNEVSESVADPPSTFSLLATFGPADKSNGIISKSTDKFAKDSSGPRKFWESNPFKYDSSDEDDDVVKKAPKVPKQTVLKITPTESFFFAKKDKRFEGLVEYFLDPSNDERIDFDEKRRELRSIVKAKARNAKRKDEKRTIAIKRAIRKKKKYQKSVIKKNSSNAVKLGG